MLCVLIFSFDV